MISNQLANNLRFNTNSSAINDKIGILNQNPLIITKSEAFNFNYTDPDRLKYAQLLAKRDMQNIKATESVKETTVNLFGTQGSSKKVVRTCNVVKKKIEERVSSVKRVPGPQTPSRLSNINKERSSILKPTGMPARSMSPPVRDTDTNWKPNQNGQAVNRLQLQMDQCSNKLDRLERNLRAQSLREAPPGSVIIPRVCVVPPKPQKDLQVLENKLRSLVECAPASEMNSTRITAQNAPRFSVAPQHRPKLPIDDILTRLDCLSSEMEEIHARWTSLPYENVSECGDDDRMSETFRFTRPMDTDRWHEDSCNVEDERVCLDVPSNTVVRLEADRRRFEDNLRFPILAGINVTAARVGEWFSEDIVNEAAEEVIREFDEAGAQLVEAILNDELTD